MILSDVETMVRQDLFDPLGNPNMRWQTSDIDRAIDKAVDRYAQYYPNVVYADLATEPFQRTYPYPQPWDASYPVWWIERVLYPLQVYGSYFPPPGAGMTASAATGAGLGIGAYQYAITFLSQGGETPPSPGVSVTTTSGQQQVNMASIPVAASQPAMPGVATNTVIGRNLYRSAAGGATLFLLATIPDNSTTTWLDAQPDSALANKPAPPTVNTSGVMLWPPYERDFAEYSNLFDSTAALAAGGNLGSGGSIGVDNSPAGNVTESFTLKLSSAELPRDTTLVMRVFYATKHQLDSSGSTIPEVHRDIIILGAVAYAMEAYQVPTNDNFDFQDGALRDRVDDTHIPQSWLAAIQERRLQFETRLQEIKNQRDFATSSRAHWGDIPARWPRL